MLSRIYGTALKAGLKRSFIIAAFPQYRITSFRTIHTSSIALVQEQPNHKPIEDFTPKKTDTSTGATEVPDLTPLKYEQSLYATINIHNRPFLVTEGDIIILPFRMKHADIGDTLQFTDITTIGSRNYTYHVKEGLPANAVSIKGTILEKTKNPMYVKEITKKRNRRTRHVQVKHDLTKIRITELKLNV